MYDSPRDTAPQLRRYLALLETHRAQLERQLAELQANIDEVRAHEKDARATLARSARPARAAARKG
jgi:septal ring factor EnvC (AmiA/AmiB activator)